MSLSKPVTAVAVMQLAEQGKLDLHADVNTFALLFIPWLDYWNLLGFNWREALPGLGMASLCRRLALFPLTDLGGGSSRSAAWARSTVGYAPAASCSFRSSAARARIWLRSTAMSRGTR